MAKEELTRRFTEKDSPLAFCNHFTREDFKTAVFREFLTYTQQFLETDQIKLRVER
jgi:hypothetical protein